MARCSWARRSKTSGFDERTTTAGVRDLIDAACELVPQGWTAALKTARAGLRPATPDGLPVIGRSAALPGLVYATGHYRSGVQLAPLTAQLVADLVLDEQGRSAAGARRASTLRMLSRAFAAMNDDDLRIGDCTYRLGVVG